MVLRAYQRTIRRLVQRGIIVVPMDAERLSSEKPVKPRKPADQRAKIPARKTDWPKRPMRGRNSFQDNR